jgi:hypothetical protein
MGQRHSPLPQTAGKPAIIAQEVKKGDALLKLRDENGVPA